MNDHPIPDRLASRPRDDRGYPIPYGVYIDRNGKPHFAVNDHIRVMEIERKDLCSLCGKPLLRGRWFIGGPASAFHPMGCYLDRPMHDECAHYALKVCPYLATPRWSGLDQEKTIERASKQAVIMIDRGHIDERPGVFVAVMAVGQRLAANGQYVQPHRPHRKVEYWRHGRQITEQEAAPFVAEAMQYARDKENSQA